MKLAIFDFDGTLLPVDTLPLLLRLWSEFGYSRPRKWRTFAGIAGLYTRYKLRLHGKMTREQMKKTALQKFTVLFSGMTRQQVHIFFKASSEVILAQLNEDVAAEMKRTKAAGYHTVILSGCYEKLLEYVGDHLGADTVLGTKMHYLDGDIADVNYPMDIRTGTDKVERIKEVFPDADYEASCAYADSFSDLPLMELVGEPVAVVPDPALRDVLCDKNWRVIE